MTKRLSNQITFTEQKKLIEIKEMYLATNLDIENLVASNDAPLDSNDGQLWFNTSNNISSDQRLMIFQSGEWVVHAEQFTPSVQVTGVDKPYLWNYEETIYSIGAPEISAPILIGVFGKGADGKGILYIYNYYGVTQTDSLPAEDKMPENFWKEQFSSIGSLSSENKYLWNYEHIIYTDGSDKKTDPVIIGVYGDSGEDAITFNIYSTKGFEFINSVDEAERLHTIELQLAAFKGSKPLEYEENVGPIYTWSWYNPNIETYTQVKVTAESVGEYWILENNGYAKKILPGQYDSTMTYYSLSTSSGDVIISSDNKPLLEVKIDDDYAFANLKCVMTYDNNDYISYVTLTERVDIYNANIKFFNGTNVFSQTDKYIPMYVELYKNNKLEESVRTNDCYIGNSVVDLATGIITTDYVVSEDDKDDESALLMYFVCTLENGITTVVEEIEDESDKVISSIVLGEYDELNNIWRVADDFTKYYYVNDIDQSNTSHVFLIKKDDVNKSRDIGVAVYTEMKDEIDGDNTIQVINSDSLVALTHAVITDLNDVIIDLNEPEKYEGRMWLDMRDGILKICTNGEWVPTAKQQPGQNAYTKQPDTYNIGDLWIISGDYTSVDPKFVEGSIWIAEKGFDGKFNPDDWSDAVPEITGLQNNVKKHFTFSEDTQTGLKISQKMSNGLERFYININSQRMSFCEDTNVEIPKGEDIKPFEDPHEVVYIGNTAAKIRKLEVHDGATIHGEATVEKIFHIVEPQPEENPRENPPGFTLQLEPNGSLSLIKKVGGN